MTRPTGPDDAKYGGTGEFGVMTTGAPAWDGDLTALDDNELTERVESLGTHIGNLHTRWEFGRGSHMVWRPATAAELRRAELARWVAARVAALQLIEDRRASRVAS